MINHPHRGKKPVTDITRAVAKKVLAVVDAGLVSGLGEPKPGKMCVEAAVCYAMGLPHGDQPSCVARTLRNLKIRLNDSSWSSNGARASGRRGCSRLTDARRGGGPLVSVACQKRQPFYSGCSCPKRGDYAALVKSGIIARKDHDEGHRGSAMNELIKSIQEALNTEETGDALVEVARSACRTEQELAAFKKYVQDNGNNLAALQSAWVRLP